MHRATLAILTVGLALLAEQAPAHEPQAASNLDESAGHNAQLFVYRIHSAGLGNWLNLVVDGVQVARIGNNDCTSVRVPPGKHLIEMSRKVFGGGAPTVRASFEALPDSDNYYKYDQIYNLTNVTGTIEYRLDKIDKAEAEPELARCKTVKPAGSFSQGRLPPGG